MEGNTIPQSFPAASITLFDLPEKIAVACNLDEMPIKQIRAITESLTAFLSDKDCKVLFLPDDLNLMFFYPREEGIQNAVNANVHRRDFLAACSKEDSCDAGPTGSNPEGGEETEDDN